MFPRISDEDAAVLWSVAQRMGTLVAHLREPILRDLYNDARIMTTCERVKAEARHKVRLVQRRELY